MPKRKMYPAGFIKRVKAEYPIWPELHRALDLNSSAVVGFLTYSTSSNVNWAYLVKLIDENKIKQFHKEIDQFVRRRKLYRECLKFWS